MADRIPSFFRFPALVLLAAAGVLFFVQHDEPGFLPGHHGFVSSHGLAIAGHFSPMHQGLMYSSLWQNPDGVHSFEVYSRFPVGTFALIRMVMWPFADDIAAQVYVARNLMGLFFMGALWFAFLSLRRLISKPWVAASAVLLAYSSYYALYYNDLVFNDVPTLFGVMLTFHGMVIYAQTGRMWQLALKAALGLLLGWQVYALLLPYLLLGGIKRARETQSLVKGLRSHYGMLGIWALFWGGVLLGVNLINEFRATEVPFLELSTVQALSNRLGFGAPEVFGEYVEQLAWGAFLKEQLYRIGQASMPFLLSRMVTAQGVYLVVGGCALGGSLALAWRGPHKRLLLSLAVVGLCWALPLRHFVAFHDFQSLFYVGIPLVLYTGGGYYLARKAGDLMPVVTMGALFIFTFSVIQINPMKASQADQVLVHDFERIKAIVGTGQRVYVDGEFRRMGGARHALGFYLAGSRFQFTPERATYILSEEPDALPGRRTPENRQVFLFDAASKAAATEPQIP